MSICPFVIRRGKRYSWRREVRGITIQVPLFTDDPKIARTVAAACTATSVQAFEALTDGRVDRETARAMVEQAARIEAARQTLRTGMWFFPFPYESAAALRARNFTEEAIIRWIRGREPAKPEDLKGWDPDDIAEYWAIYNGSPVSPQAQTADLPEPAAETSAQAVASAMSAPTVIIHNTFPGYPTAAPQRAPEPAPEPEREVPSPSARRSVRPLMHPRR